MMKEMKVLAAALLATVALPLSAPAEAGDLLLKGGALVLNYGGKPKGKTGQKAARLARIDGAQAKELAEALGTGSVTVRFSLEWSE